MIRFGVLLYLAILVLWIYSIFDSITADESRVRTLQKPLWVIIVLLFGSIGIGSVAWIVWGKPRTTPGRPGGGWGGGGRGPSGPSSFGPPPGRRRKPPIAPDDDPDFLKSL